MRLVAFAVLALTAPAIAEPAATCTATATMDRLIVSLHDGTGDIKRVTTGKPPVRHVAVTATVATDTTTLIFAGYLPDDSKTIRGKPRSRPATEKLVKGETVVGSLQRVGDETRFVPGTAIDFVTGTQLVATDGYLVCK
ncbi:MAG TPA: hypothetical protein VGM90_33425 [Kofleriaceae bacterium]